MADLNTTDCWLFPKLASKTVVAKFDQQQTSSDGGAVLLKAAESRLGVVDRISGCVSDERDETRVQHDISSMVSQRVYGLACGYSDCNDAERIGNDPVFKLLADRAPDAEGGLASQPTLTRFENSVSSKDLMRMGTGLADAMISRHRKRLKGRAKRVTIDLDVTDDETHGRQQLSFFNGFYDSWCYLPLLGFVTFDDEDEQYLVGALLRPGNAPTAQGALGMLRRIISLVRQAFPKARIRVRLDGGFATPEILGALTVVADEYVVGMAKNSVLKKYAEGLMVQARELSEQSGETEHVFGECQYQAQTWDAAQRVVIKAEVVRHPGREPRENPRFVVTNMNGDPTYIYKQVYCRRGEVENRIKELQNGLDIGRTSCTRFWANQLRVLLTTAAYMLLQEIRLKLRRTALARAQVTTLREKLLKLGASVTVSVRRVVLSLPASYPYLRAWGAAARSLGAAPG